MLLLSCFRRVSIDGSPPGSPTPGILQARTLEWVASSFSNTWKWKVKVKSLSHVWLLVTPWTAAYQAPSSMGFSRQEYWSGVPLPSPLEYVRGGNLKIGKWSICPLFCEWSGKLDSWCVANVEGLLFVEIFQLKNGREMIEYQYFPLVTQTVKNLPAVREAEVWSLDQENLLERGMATHSNILAWRIPWTEKLAGYSPKGHIELDMNE